MATSTAEFRNLVSNYKSITAASRASGNSDENIKGQLEGLQAQLAPYVAEGYSAGGYDDADTISKDITRYINLITVNAADKAKAAATPPTDTKADTKKDDPKVADGEKTGDTNPKEAAAASKKSTTENATKNSSNLPDAGTIVVTDSKLPGKTAEIDNNPTEGIPGRRTYNPLSNLSSYTYKLSLYLINPDTYNDWMQGGTLIPDDMELICQSGGINEHPKTSGGDNPRAEGFDLDFYIDNLWMETQISPSKIQTVASVTTQFKFQIIEPYGFTFPTKLNATVAKAQTTFNDTKVNKIVATGMQNYLLVIRFYGYDKSGKLVKGSDYPQPDTNRTDSQSVFERSFPIRIADMKFKLDNKSTTYTITANLVGEADGQGTMRSTVWEKQSIRGTTVEDALTGPNGLITVLNNHQKQLVADKRIGVADSYKIKFADNSGISEALIVEKNFYNKDRTPLFAAKKTDEVNVKASASGAGESIKKAERVIEVAGGTPIIQTIEQIISQSSYIKDKLPIKIKEQKSKVNNSDDSVVTNKTKDVFTWFNVTASTTRIGTWDNIRNMYPTEITYTIQPYKVPYLAAADAGISSKYYGPHKRYEYWYTGKNTEVLSYELSYNQLYYTASQIVSPAATNKLQGTVPNYPIATQRADPTSLFSGAFESINQIRTFLFSPEDQSKAVIRILGDPDYLMTATAGSIQTALKQWYGDNFTINPCSGQVFIEIDFKQVEDYDLKTGLLSGANSKGPNNNIDFYIYPKDLGEKTKGMIHMLHTVRSTFSHGNFTQELHSVLPPVLDMSDLEDPNGNKSAAQRSESTASTPAASAPQGPQPGKPATSSTGQGQQTLLNQIDQNNIKIQDAKKNYEERAAAARAKRLAQESQRADDDNSDKATNKVQGGR